MEPFEFYVPIPFMDAVDPKKADKIKEDTDKLMKKTRRLMQKKSPLEWKHNDEYGKDVTTIIEEGDTNGRDEPTKSGESHDDHPETDVGKNGGTISESD